MGGSREGPRLRPYQGRAAEAREESRGCDPRRPRPQCPGVWGVHTGEPVGEGNCWLYYPPLSARAVLFSRRKCQEANQKVQGLQASQEARADQEQRIRVRYSVSGAGWAWWMSWWWSQPSSRFSRGTLRVSGDRELPVPTYCGHCRLSLCVPCSGLGLLPPTSPQRCFPVRPRPPGPPASALPHAVLWPWCPPGSGPSPLHTRWPASRSGLACMAQCLPFSQTYLCPVLPWPRCWACTGRRAAPFNVCGLTDLVLVSCTELVP